MFNPGVGRCLFSSSTVSFVTDANRSTKFVLMLCVRLLTCDANLDVRDAVRDLVLPLCHHLCSGLFTIFYYNNMLEFLLEGLWDFPAG
jgi:hypothetical protein